MLIEALVYIIGFYILAGLLMYAYGVLKSWEFTKVWNFKIADGYVGIFTYPRFMLFWLEWIVRKINGLRQK
jgi:hypothetical protein